MSPRKVLGCVVFLLLVRDRRDRDDIPTQDSLSSLHPKLSNSPRGFHSSLWLSLPFPVMVDV